MSLETPVFAELAEYGDRLGDVAFWEPYVREALDRHHGGCHDVVAGFVGTYPTFLVGDLVVKLFGHFPGWEDAFATERAVHARLARHPDLPVPRVLGHGQLFEQPENAWPYLITERLPGTAWRDADLTNEQVRGIAHQLGQIMRVVHDLVPGASEEPRPDEACDLPGDWASDHADQVVDRQRSRGSLHERMITEIPTYVRGLPDPAERRLLHADLTRDHVFVADGRLVGVIDWGDAMVADRYYELAALHLDLFVQDTSVLQEFLDGYGWHPPADFEHRALGLALLHQFDVFASTSTEHDSLPELASALFGIHRPVERR